MQRPAERVATEIERRLKRPLVDGWVEVSYHDTRYDLVPRRTLKRWHSLLKSVDARMRLDGSPLNRRKKKETK